MSASDTAEKDRKQLELAKTSVGDILAVVDLQKKILDKSIEGAKHDKKPSLGTTQYKGGGMDATDAIKQIDPKNLAGAIPFALELVQQLRDHIGPEKIIEQMIGQNLTSLIQNFSQMLQQGMDTSKIEQ